MQTEPLAIGELTGEILQRIEAREKYDKRDSKPDRQGSTYFWISEGRDGRNRKGYSKELGVPESYRVKPKVDEVDFLIERIRSLDHSEWTFRKASRLDFFVNFVDGPERFLILHETGFLSTRDDLFNNPKFKKLFDFLIDFYHDPKSIDLPTSQSFFSTGVTKMATRYRTKSVLSEKWVSRLEQFSNDELIEIYLHKLEPNTVRTFDFALALLNYAMRRKMLYSQVWHIKEVWSQKFGFQIPDLKVTPY